MSADPRPPGPALWAKFIPALPPVLATGALVYRPSLALALAVVALAALAAVSLWLDRENRALEARVGSLEDSAGVLAGKVEEVVKAQTEDHLLLTKVANRTAAIR